MEEEKKQAPQEEMTYDKKMKDLQMEFLNKMGSGGLNQNDLMAFMTMMQKKEPDNFREIMQMSQMMQMMNPQQDSMSQIMPLIIMDSMRGNGDSEIKKELENVKAEMRRRDEDKKYDMVMREIRDIKGNKDQIGTKEFLTMLINKDDKMADMWRQMSEKDREAYQRNLDILLKSKQSGGDNIGKLGEQIKQVKALGATLGFGKEGEKSKLEQLGDIVGGVITPAINNPGVQNALTGFGNQMTANAEEKIRRIKAGRSPSNPGNPIPARQVTPEEMKKMQGNPAPQETENPNPPVEANPQDSYRDEDGNLVTPSVIQVSDSGIIPKKVKK